MRTKFYNVLAVAVMLLAGVSFTSCFQSADSISKREILKQVNKEIKERAEDVVYFPLEIGTFECNDDSHRLFLRKLENAGIVDYGVERYAWWEKEIRAEKESYRVHREGYWYSYYDWEYRWVNKTYYNFEDHYVVTLALNSKGKRISVDALPEAEEKVDKDMEEPEVDPSKYSWNKADLSEEWPNIANPFLEPEPQAEQEVEEICEDSGYYEEGDDDCDYIEDAEPQDDNITRIDEEQFLAYNRVKENSNTVYIKACEVKAVKARNIQIYDNEDGFRCARAEVIISTTKTTDAGRIAFGCEDDKKELLEVELTYYEDKGWVLTDMD